MNSFPVHVIGTQRKCTGQNADNIKGMPTRHTFSSRKSHVIASVSNPSLPLSMVLLTKIIIKIQFCFAKCKNTECEEEEGVGSTTDISGSRPREIC